MIIIWLLVCPKIVDGFNEFYYSDFLLQHVWLYYLLSRVFVLQEQFNQHDEITLGSVCPEVYFLSNRPNILAKQLLVSEPDTLSFAEP